MLRRLCPALLLILHLPPVNLFGQSLASPQAINTAVPAAAAVYKVFPLPVPVTWTDVHGTGINNSGQVVGYGFNGTAYQPFVGNASSFEPVPLPPGFYSGRALAINSSGQIVGWGLGQATPNPQAFIGGSGGTTAVPLTGGFYSSDASAINDSGQIAGAGFLPGPMLMQAFIATSSGMTAVPNSPDWSGDVEAYSLNNLGQIIGIGDYQTAGNLQFFFGDSSGIVSLVPMPSGFIPDTSPSFSDRVMQLNDRGQIVGQLDSADGSGIARVFLSTLTSTMLLPTLPPCLYAVNPSLNSAGQVVGASCEGFIWDAQNGMRALDRLVPSGWHIYVADGINDKGQILAAAGNNGVSGLAILEPLLPTPDTTPPVIAPQFAGTLGNNGWYRSVVNVTWSVTDPESGIASLSGCVQALLTADSAGYKLSCSAKNGAGLSSAVTVTVKIDKTPPSSKVSPLSASQLSASFPVKWSGSDALSGIQDFTIYVSDNAGPFVPWLTNTTAMQAAFIGIPGHRYAFYSIARDVAGNVESAKSTADASTVIPVFSLSLSSSNVMGLGQSVKLPVSLSAPAPTAGVNVTLISSDPSHVTVTPTVFIAAGKMSPNTQPLLTGLNLGTVSITASATGYISDTKQARVTGTLSFARCCVSLLGAVIQNAILTLSGPAPAGGLTVNLSSDNPSVATVPATVTFPAKTISVNVPIKGITAGATVIHANSLPNLADVSIKVTVQH